MGSGQFAFLHPPYVVIGRTLDLIFDGFATRTVADGQALDSMLDD